MISSTDDGKRTPFTKLERGNVESREKNTKKRWQDTGNSCKLHSSLWKNTNSPHRSRCLIDDSQFLAWVVRLKKKRKKEKSILAHITHIIYCQWRASPQQVSEDPFTSILFVGTLLPPAGQMWNMSAKTQIPFNLYDLLSSYLKKTKFKKKANLFIKHNSYTRQFKVLYSYIKSEEGK